MKRGSWFIPKNPDAYLASQAAMPPPAPRVYYPRELLAPGYLRRGYGGTRKWPFSKEKAFREPGYQRGIRNAIRNPAYARPWRTAAARRLEEVEEMERAEEERRIFDAAQEEWDSAPVPEDVEADLSQVEAVQDALDRRFEYGYNKWQLRNTGAMLRKGKRGGVGKYKRR